MKTTTRQTLVERLTSRMDLDRIFMFSYPFLEKEQPHLLLVVNPVNGLSPNTLVPLVSLCLSDMEEIPFDIIPAGEWQNHLKQGSLFYTYVSLPPHELHAPPKKKSPLFSHKAIAGLLELSELHYDKCRKSSDEFREGADHFIAKEDYSQATFMLHQFLELRLKGFQATAGIKANKSHNVEHLMKSLRGVAPQLLSIFPYDGPSVELFRLLDKSYTQAKKAEGIDILHEEFDILLEKCGQVREVMDHMVVSMADRIAAYREQLAEEAPRVEEANKQQQSSNPATAGTGAATQLICEDFSGFPWPDHYKQDVNALLEKIRKNHNPEQITMLNYHTGGFSEGNLFQRNEGDEIGGSKVELYLIVLLKNKGPFTFRCMKAGITSAMIVYLNVDYVEKKLAAGNRFLHTIWTKGWVLRKKSDFAPSFTMAVVDWKEEHDRVVEIWNNAKACLDHLNNVLQNTDELKADTGLLLLRNLFEIGVHTYLRCTVGFVPKQLNLAELIDWSGITGRKLLDFIYPASEMDKARLQLVLWPEMLWWKNLEIGISNVSQSFYRETANETRKFFERLCKEVLSELESKIGSVADVVG